MPKVVSTEENIRRAVAVHGDKYIYDSSSVIRATDKVSIVCREHGAFLQKFSNHLNGAGCPMCSGRNVDWVARFKSVHGEKYDYSKVIFTSTKDVVEIVCNEHGSFYQTPDNHYRGKQGCPACKGKRIRSSKQLGIDEFVARAKVVHRDAFAYSNKQFENMLDSDIEMTCIKHSTVCYQSAVNHLAGKNPCTKCQDKKSKGEAELADFVASLGFDVKRSVPLLNGKHIDIYVESRKFGIEYHGLFWHTEERRGKMFHRNKWDDANAQGIRLIQVFEDEWLEKRDIVKNRIKYMLGYSEKINARDCTIEKLDSEYGRELLNKYHIQGAGRAPLYYGLIHKNEIVAVASFGKSRSGAMVSSSADGVWEVIRFASSVSVRGGFSRLFKRFIKDVQPEKVISYCDLRYGNGKVYEASGFTMVSITEPDYWWVPRGEVKRVPRYTTQKHKLEKHETLGHFYSPEKTEQQICSDAGWEKIYGVGNQRWVWKKNSI